MIFLREKQIIILFKNYHLSNLSSHINMLTLLISICPIIKNKKKVFVNLNTILLKLSVWIYNCEI